MDGWLKGLIAITCIVVIGGVGYFVIADRAEQNRRSSLAIEYSDRDKCRERVDDIKAGKLSGDDILILQDCAMKSLVNKSDFEDAMKARTARTSG
jgi:hypothetical protein